MIAVLVHKTAETHFIQQTVDRMTSRTSNLISTTVTTLAQSSLVTHLKPFGSPSDLPSWPPRRQLCPTQQLPSPSLLNGCGWDGVKVITGPWIFVSTHFISVRLPTGKSMSSSLMKDLHLCPMGLLVFILSPNMVSMRSPDTVAHVSYSMWHWCINVHSHEAMKAGELLSNCTECANFHHVQVV